jgi:hypothetical protein
MWDCLKHASGAGRLIEAIQHRLLPSLEEQEAYFRAEKAFYTEAAAVTAGLTSLTERVLSPEWAVRLGKEFVECSDSYEKGLPLSAVLLKQFLESAPDLNLYGWKFPSLENIVTFDIRARELAYLEAMVKIAAGKLEDFSITTTIPYRFQGDKEVKTLSFEMLGKPTGLTYLPNGDLPVFTAFAHKKLPPIIWASSLNADEWGPKAVEFLDQLTHRLSFWMAIDHEESPRLWIPRESLRDFRRHCEVIVFHDGQYPWCLPFNDLSGGIFLPARGQQLPVGRPFIMAGFAEIIGGFCHENHHLALCHAYKSRGATPSTCLLEGLAFLIELGFYRLNGFVEVAKAYEKYVHDYMPEGCFDITNTHVGKIHIREIRNNAPLLKEAQQVFINEYLIGRGYQSAGEDASQKRILSMLRPRDRTS